MSISDYDNQLNDSVGVVKEPVQNTIIEPDINNMGGFKDDVLEDTRVSITIRIDKSTARRLQILSAIRDTTQSHIIDEALTEYCRSDSVPFPYFPPEIQNAKKMRRQFYISSKTQIMMIGRANMEMHSYDNVIYRAILNKMKELPEGII